MLKPLALALATTFAAGTAGAQDLVYWPAPQSAAASAGTSYFPVGTPVALVTRTQISTKDNHPGDRIYLEVAEPLTFQGQVVVPAGAVAVGEVARADRNGYFGRKGHLEVKLLYVQTPSGPVRLAGRAADEGTSGLAVSAATIAFVSPLGFLIHGTSAHLPYGTVVQASLAEELRFARQPARAVAAAAYAVPDAHPLPAHFDPATFVPGGIKTAAR